MFVAMLIFLLLPIVSLAAQGQVQVINAVPGAEYAIIKSDTSQLFGTFKVKSDSTAVIAVPPGEYVILQYNEYLSYGMHTDGARNVTVKPDLAAVMDFAAQKHNQYSAETSSGIMGLLVTTFVIGVGGLIAFCFIQCRPDYN